MSGIGITATDTDMGKTVIAGLIAAAFHGRGVDTGVYKPAASGCVQGADGKLISEDVEFLLRAVGRDISHQKEAVCYTYLDALAPSEASKLVGEIMEPERLINRGLEVLGEHEQAVIEGVGGLAVPLTEKFLVKDFFQALGIPLLLVVRPILGNVNHAVLSVEYARKYGLDIRGIVVNAMPEERGILETSNLHYYESLTGLPVVGIVPKLDADVIAKGDSATLAALAEKYLDVDKIIGMVR